MGGMDVMDALDAVDWAAAGDEAPDVDDAGMRPSVMFRPASAMCPHCGCVGEFVVCRADGTVAGDAFESGGADWQCPGCGELFLVALWPLDCADDEAEAIVDALQGRG